MYIYTEKLTIWVEILYVDGTPTFAIHIVVKHVGPTGSGRAELIGSETSFDV